MPTPVLRFALCLGTTALLGLAACQSPRLASAPEERVDVATIDRALVPDRRGGLLTDIAAVTDRTGIGTGDLRLIRAHASAPAWAEPQVGGLYRIGGADDGDAPAPVDSTEHLLDAAPGTEGHPTHGIPGPHSSEPGRLFPLWGKEVQSRGHELPLPIGFSGGYFFTEREMKITRLDVAFGGNPINTSSVLVEPQSRASAWEVKADLWVLPFLNVYAFYGRISTNTRTTVTIPNPLPPPGRPDISFSLPTKLDGDTRGVGLVLVGGYKSWFASVNANYSVTELGFDDEITANVNTLRIGRHGRVGKFELSGWVGGAFWNVEKSVEGTITVPNTGDIDFAVDYEPVEPFNVTVGGHVTFDKRFEGVVEYGFWENVTTLTFQVGMRI